MNPVPPLANVVEPFKEINDDPEAIRAVVNVVVLAVVVPDDVTASHAIRVLTTPTLLTPPPEFPHHIPLAPLYPATNAPPPPLA